MATRETERFERSTMIDFWLRMVGYSIILIGIALFVTRLISAANLRDADVFMDAIRYLAGGYVIGVLFLGFSRAIILLDEIRAHLAAGRGPGG